MKNIGFVGCEDTRSWVSKYNSGPRLLISKLIFIGNFECFLKKKWRLELYLGFEWKNFESLAGVSKNDFYVSNRTIPASKHFLKDCKKFEHFSDP